MYAIQDGYSFWVWPFFILLIFLGSWFVVNLALVVIATQFKVTKKRYDPENHHCIILVNIQLERSFPSFF